MLKKIFSIEQVIVVIIAMLVVYGIINVSLNLSFLASLGESNSDFSITDVFYEIENSTNQKSLNDEIWLVDVTDVYNRGELAEIIDTICSYAPVVVGIDIILPHPKFGVMA